MFFLFLLFDSVRYIIFYFGGLIEFSISYLKFVAVRSPFSRLSILKTEKMIWFLWTSSDFLFAVADRACIFNFQYFTLYTRGMIEFEVLHLLSGSSLERGAVGSWMKMRSNLIQCLIGRFFFFFFKLVVLKCLLIISFIKNIITASQMTIISRSTNLFSSNLTYLHS